MAFFIICYFIFGLCCAAFVKGKSDKDNISFWWKYSFVVFSVLFWPIVLFFGFLLNFYDEGKKF